MAEVEETGLPPVPEETERYLLIEAVRRNSVAFLVEQGIQANYFRAYEKAARVLFNYFNQHQCLPSQKRLAKDMDIFDWYDFPEERDVPDFMEELIHHQAMSFFSNLIYNCTYKLDLHEKEGYRNRDAWIETVEETVVELSSLRSILIPSAMDDWTTDVDMFNNALARAKDRQEGKLFKPFAHSMMNQVLGQMRNGQFIVYLGRPKEGKTMLTLLDAHSIWSNTDEDVMYVSSEMDKLRIGARLESIHAHYSNTDLAKGVIRRYDEAGTVVIEDDFDAYLSYRRELSQSPNRFWIRSKRNQSTGHISPATIKADVLQKGVGTVVVDYIGNIESDKSYRDKKSKIASIVYDLKDMAEQLGVTVLAPQHTNRDAVKSQNVGAEHIADADEVGKAADLLLGINKQPMEEGKANEPDLEETGSYLLTVNVIAGRDAGGQGATFGWNWNFDNGVRFEIGKQNPDGNHFKEAREKGKAAGRQMAAIGDPLDDGEDLGFGF